MGPLWFFVLPLVIVIAPSQGLLPVRAIHRRTRAHVSRRGSMDIDQLPATVAHGVAGRENSDGSRRGHHHPRNLSHPLSGQSDRVEADEPTTGPAHFVVADPEGNPILVDQHV